MTPKEMWQFIDNHSIASLQELNDSSRVEELQQYLASEGYGQQLILSHYLEGNPFSDEPVEYPISFLALGQRYTADSEVFSNVVFDRVPDRCMPNPLDVMFTLGDPIALSLLPQDELPLYSGNLASMRGIMDNHPEGFWDSSVYHRWLDSFRSLHKDTTGEEYPEVFRQESWTKKMLNTQLASWSQLRHDTILYAKQSYTSGIVCYYPRGYVEPYPEFYTKITDMALYLKSILLQHSYPNSNTTTFLDNFASHCATLTSIANKEIEHEAFSPEDIQYLDYWFDVTYSSICGVPPTYDGYYFKLYYNMSAENVMNEFDPEIADVHTCPASDLCPGGILNVATGGAFPIHIAVEDENGCVTIYTGSASEYFQFEDTKRSNDEDWKQRFINEDIPDYLSWQLDFMIP